MAGKYLGFPFDEEIFSYHWENTADPTITHWLNSGVMVKDSKIESMIQNGSDTYTVPFYNLLQQTTPDNYDGATDVTFDTLDGHTQSGIVYGRMHGWEENEFINVYNSGANVMQAIVSQIKGYWAKDDEKVLRGIIGGVLQTKGMESHNVDTNELLDINVFGDVAQEVFGENRDKISMYMMHSKVARELEKLELLEFKKGTDPNALQHGTRLAQFDGKTVIVDDSLPVEKGEGTDTHTVYAMTYGSLGFANANVAPAPLAEVVRDPVTNGGMNKLINRRRQSIHPYGFNYNKPKSGYTASPTDAQLFNKTNWSLVDDANSIGMLSFKVKVNSKAQASA